MTSQTLLNEIVTEVRLHNPSATRQTIAEGITAIISNEIFPEVMRNLSVPKFPSYRSVATAEARSARGRRRTGTEKPISLGDRRRIIQQVEHVRTQMGWDGIDYMKPRIHVIDSPSPYYTPKTDLLLSIEAIREEELEKGPYFEKESEPREKETVNGTFQKMTKQPERNLIVLSDSAQKKVVSDQFFDAVFRDIEVQLRNLIESRNLRIEIDVTCKFDVEIPSWDKCVLTIHPPPELTFDERMNISTIFDLTIRKTINEMKRDADDTTRDYLKDLNRKMFVHIDL
jgi:hypothetical protein